MLDVKALLVSTVENSVEREEQAEYKGRSGQTQSQPFILLARLTFGREQKGTGLSLRLLRPPKLT